jgi:hypothetical protein
MTANPLPFAHCPIFVTPGSSLGTAPLLSYQAVQTKETAREISLRIDGCPLSPKVFNVTTFPSWRLLGSLLLATTLCTSRARADLLWYNGDYDNRDSLTNESQVPVNTGSGYVLEKSLVYDNFIVPTGQTWTLTSLFSNNQIAYYANPTTATWEIRSGVSAGNGGTLVASGDSAATLTAVTTVSGYYYAAPEYTVSVAVSNITLTAGTYWLAVAPDSAGYYGDQSYIETTSGANAVGSPPGDDGNSFINSNSPGAPLNFAPTSSVLNDPGAIDFSMGVVGTFVAGVPEPSSWGLVLVGLIGPAAYLRRRKQARKV